MLQAWGMPYDVIPARFRLCSDVNLDGAVDMNDVHQIAACFGSEADTRNWDSVNDVNSDQVVNMLDLYIVILICKT
jgi:hypothetical protein